MSNFLGNLLSSKNNKKLFFQIYKLVSANFIYSFLGFVNVIYIGRNLQPYQYANFSIALSIFYFFKIANEPLRMIFAKKIPEYFNENCVGKIRSLIKYIVKYLSIFILFLIVLFFTFGKNIVKIAKLPSNFFLFTVLIYIIINLFLSLYRGVQNGLQNYKNFINSFYFESVSRLILTILIFLVIRNSLSAFSSYILASMIALIYLLSKKYKILKHKEKTINQKKLFNFVRPLLIFSISFIAFYSIDLFMAKVYLTGSQAGYYAAASQLTKSIAIIGASFNFLLLPHITDSVHNNQRPLTEFFKIKIVFIIIAFFIILIFSLFSTPIIKLLYTSKYLDASNLLLPLGLGTLFMTLSSLIGNYFLAINEYRVFIIPIFFIFIEIILILINHSSSLQISHMFLFSQLSLFILLFISLFIFKPKKSSIKLENYRNKRRFNYEQI